MKVETQRLILRELELDDVTPAYLSWMLDPETNRFLETRHYAQSVETIREFVTRVAAATDEFLFGIFLRNGHHIGNIKIGPIRPIHRVADLSLLIGDAGSRGNGYATEAIQGLSQFAFRELEVLKLSASMYAPNEGSRRAFLRAGFRQEGVRIKHYDLGGERCDVIELGATPAEMA